MRECNLTHHWASKVYCVQDERSKVMKERLSRKDGDKSGVLGSENTRGLWARSKRSIFAWRYISKA